MTIDELIANPDAIKPLIKPMGYCIVSCKIMKDSLPVGYMYREQSPEDEDSGWRFLSGTESDDYLDDEENSKVIDVNIVANFDPAIIPFLKKPFNSEYERVGDTFTEL